MPVYNHSLENLLKTYQFYTPDKKDRHQVVMNGNEALAYGLIAAGVRFGAGYPITPWSDIMELLRRELPKYGGSFIQTEDEIAAISMAIGGSYAGRVGGHRFQRAGHFVEDRGARLGGHGGNAARRRGRATRRPFDRHADERRAIGFEHRLFWRPR